MAVSAFSPPEEVRRHPIYRALLELRQRLEHALAGGEICDRDIELAEEIGAWWKKHRASAKECAHPSRCGSNGADCGWASCPLAGLRSKIRTGAWLRWAYETLPEREYLLLLHATRIDQGWA